MNEYGKKTSGKIQFQALRGSYQSGEERTQRIQKQGERRNVYLANIENKGQHPSLQIFFELMSRYHISVDQFLFGDTTDGKTTARRQLDAQADQLTDREIGIILATVQAVLDAREKGE